LKRFESLCAVDIEIISRSRRSEIAAPAKKENWLGRTFQTCRKGFVSGRIYENKKPLLSDGRNTFDLIVTVSHLRFHFRGGAAESR